MEKKESLSVLISPLDWGLGHATRCIPLINSFLRANCIVYVACNPVIKQLLIQEFPHDVCFLPLKGYTISYSSSKRYFAIKILLQIPKIIVAIQSEHQWLKKVVIKYDIGLIISDNRYGLFHQNIPSVFITHQLQIQTPFSWLTHIIQRINYRFINQFTECWVPDYPSDRNIAGILSHPVKMPSVPVAFVGPLSRFSKLEHENIKYKWLFILSGPEPQRTQLEIIFCKLIPALKGNILLLRGLPDNTSHLQVSHQCTVFNHLPTEKMQLAFAQSEFIVSRSGYTTVMEILSLQKKSIVIPTPGQTEQEYLAWHLMKQHLSLSCQQNNDLFEQFTKAQSFHYSLPAFTSSSLQETVDECVTRYSARL